ncbi:MAG: nitrite reductase small subunit NirD [Acidobacteria bacterium]|nr:nitrite reductase small subunit NirD [Acidobacteriota bacterium]
MLTETLRECDWIPVTEAGNIPPREGRSLCLNGKELAVFNLNGRFLTIDNHCPHKGGPLCDGIVSGTAVVCPLHGRRFDLETGLPVRADDETSLATYPTRMEGGVIYIGFPTAQEAAGEAA